MNWMRTRRLIIPLLTAMLLAGCQTARFDAATAVPPTTQPTARDLDASGIQRTRPISTFTDRTIRIYEHGRGTFLVNERTTFVGGNILPGYLQQLDHHALRPGVIYFIAKSDIAERDVFAAIKEFCIRHNVDLYIAEPNAWSRRKAPGTDLGTGDEASWIVQATR